MKLKFLLIGHYEQSVITSAQLGSTGISTEDAHFVLGKHMGMFDTYDEAFREMNDSEEKPELGFEIKPLFVKS